MRQETGEGNEDRSSRRENEEGRKVTEEKRWDKGMGEREIRDGRK